MSGLDYAESLLFSAGRFRKSAQQVKFLARLKFAQAAVTLSTTASIASLRGRLRSVFLIRTQAGIFTGRDAREEHYQLDVP